MRPVWLSCRQTDDVTPPEWTHISLTEEASVRIMPRKKASGGDIDNRHIVVGRKTVYAHLVANLPFAGLLIVYLGALGFFRVQFTVCLNWPRAKPGAPNKNGARRRRF